MQGRNSSGRRVALLNDNIELPSQPVCLSSFTPSLYSKISSYTSSSIGSPPALSSADSDLSDSTTTSAPSPTVSNYILERLPSQDLDSPVFPQYDFLLQKKDLGATHLPIPLSSRLVESQAAYFRFQPLPEQRVATTETAINARSWKKYYPCPLAHQYNCSDCFTTSGHAARHARRHTGRKDASCSECNRRFARKDNMEQHRRTHHNSQSSVKEARKTKKPKYDAKRRKPACFQSPAHLPLSYSMVDSVGSSDLSYHFGQRTLYPDLAAFSANHNHCDESFYSLDTLANAASEEKRNFKS